MVIYALPNRSCGLTLPPLSLEYPKEARIRHLSTQPPTRDYLTGVLLQG